MDYQTLNRIFLNSAAEITAAEAHGMATGMLCINNHDSSDRWLSELFGDETSVDKQKTLLGAWYDETGQALANNQFDFRLFLPDGNTCLSEQANALIDWCRGFLYGFGSRVQSAKMTPDTEEIVKDLYEISCMDSRVEGEDDEAAFMEITEYIKAAVLLIYEELKINVNRAVH